MLEPWIRHSGRPSYIFQFCCTPGTPVEQNRPQGHLQLLTQPTSAEPRQRRDADSRSRRRSRTKTPQRRSHRPSRSCRRAARSTSPRETPPGNFRSNPRPPRPDARPRNFLPPPRAPQFHPPVAPAAVWPQVSPAGFCSSATPTAGSTSWPLVPSKGPTQTCRAVVSKRAEPHSPPRDILSRLNDPHNFS